MGQIRDKCTCVCGVDKTNFNLDSKRDGNSNDSILSNGLPLKSLIRKSVEEKDLRYPQLNDERFGRLIKTQSLIKTFIKKLRFKRLKHLMKKEDKELREKLLLELKNTYKYEKATTNVRYDIISDNIKNNNKFKMSCYSKNKNNSMKDNLLNVTLNKKINNDLHNINTSDNNNENYTNDISNNESSTICNNPINTNISKINNNINNNDSNNKIINNSHIKLIKDNPLNQKPNEKLKLKTKIHYDTVGWKRFYPLGDKIFLVNYGKVFQTDLLIDKEKLYYYVGEVDIENKRHGYGVLTYLNGIQMEGFWIRNNFTGWNCYLDIDGNVYIGMIWIIIYYINAIFILYYYFIGKFVDNILNGFGEKFSYEGTYYRGEFSNFKKQGTGFEETQDIIYEGEFHNDKKQGKGKLWNKSKQDFYDGEFSNDTISGIGTFTWGNNDVYHGTFLNEKMEGIGLYKWADGNEYYGEYKNNIKEGNGKFKWTNGKIYEGPFVNGKPHGNGILTSNKAKYKVEFIEGKIVSNEETKEKTSTSKVSKISTTIDNINYKKYNKSSNSHYQHNISNDVSSYINRSKNAPRNNNDNKRSTYKNKSDNYNYEDNRRSSKYK